MEISLSILQIKAKKLAKVLTLIISLGLIESLAQETRAQVDCGREEFGKMGDISFYDWAESKSFYFFESKMSIDADGSPRAYHPDNIGLDELSYAGYTGNWWALVTDSGEKDGIPVVQGEDDPYPGYYISTTSLFDRRYPLSNPKRYVNSEEIPYFVLPPNLKSITGTELGDIAYVYNKRNKRGSFAIFADIGPNDKVGEGSIYLAEQLGIPSSPRVGGQSDQVLYLVFPFSGQRKPLTKAEIIKKGKELMDKARAWDFIEKCAVSYK